MQKIDSIKSLVRSSVESFAVGFRGRHEDEFDDVDGVINMKIHNVFIAELGKEIQYYTALVRSLDSSLGTMLEKMAVHIASLSFEVKRSVEGVLSPQQTSRIAEILEKYKRYEIRPKISDYISLREKPGEKDLPEKRHDSDYCLINRETGEHILIELKIGGDLDNKKARSEKEAILEQYAILSNELPESTDIKVYFATAYNKFGEGKPWKQERVRQYFSEEELLIGKDFWNFVCQDDHGYEIVLEAYRESAVFIKEALESIKNTYLS